MIEGTVSLLAIANMIFRIPCGSPWMTKEQWCPGRAFAATETGQARSVPWTGIRGATGTVARVRMTLDGFPSVRPHRAKGELRLEPFFRRGEGEVVTLIQALGELPDGDGNRTLVEFGISRDRP